MSKEIFVTTTENLPGYDIKRMIGPVNGFLIKSTNIFSDIVASFSDIVGGYSGSYQRQIQQLYDDVLNSLKEKAKRKGANCILNLKIDFEEISGQGKQMFLLLANGTAAIIESKSNKDFHSQTISFEELENEIEKGIFIAKIDKGGVIDKTVINESIKYCDWILAERLLRIISKYDSGYFYNAYENDISESLTLCINEYRDSKEFASAVMNIVMESNNEFIKKYWEILKNTRIFNYRDMGAMFNCPDKNRMRYYLQLIDSEKDEYDGSEIEVMEDILEKVKKLNFDISIVRKKKVLSTAETEYWHCSCETDNLFSIDRCTNCGRDKYGFKEGFINHLEIVCRLENRISALKRLTSI